MCAQMESSVNLATRRIIFVLPANNWSGGVRSTVQLAERMRLRGFYTEIVIYPEAAARRSWVQRVLASTQAKEQEGWVDYFNGPVTIAHKPERVCASENDVLILTGSYVCRHHQRFTCAALKIRFCRGLHMFDKKRMRDAWSGSLPTIANSPADAITLKEEFGLEDVAVVLNGLATEYYYDEGGPHVAVGTIYSAHKAKGPKDLTKVTRALAARQRGIRIVGFGQSSPPASLYLSKYFFRPSPDVAREVYNMCRVWLIMSSEEGFCNPGLEAMACGTPIVCTRIDGVAMYATDNVNSLKFDVGDVDTCLQHVERVLNDDDLYERLRRAGLETAKRFDWERSVDRLIEILCRMVACNS